jgi:hypothetical protein
MFGLFAKPPSLHRVNATKKISELKLEAFIDCPQILN